MDGCTVVIDWGTRSVTIPRLAARKYSSFHQQHGSIRGILSGRVQHIYIYKRLIATEHKCSFKIHEGIFTFTIPLIPFIHPFNSPWKWETVVLCPFWTYWLNVNVVCPLPMFSGSLRSRVYTPTGILFVPKSKPGFYLGALICSRRLVQELENIHRVFVTVVILCMSLNALLSAYD